MRNLEPVSFSSMIQSKKLGNEMRWQDGKEETLSKREK